MEIKNLYIMGIVALLALGVIVGQGKSSTNAWTGDLPKKQCNPSDCSTAALKTGTMKVNCDYGMIPLSCGHYIQDKYGDKKKIIKQNVYPFYNEMEVGSSGCEMNWKVGDSNNNAEVRIEAFCVPWNTAE